MQLVRVGAFVFYIFVYPPFWRNDPQFDEFEFSTGLVPWRVWQWKTWMPFEDVFPVGSIGQFQSSYLSHRIHVWYWYTYLLFTSIYHSFNQPFL